MDPELAKACDAGTVEEYETPDLGDFALKL